MKTLYLTFTKDREAKGYPVAVFRLHLFRRGQPRGEAWFAAKDRKWRECGLLVVEYLFEGLNMFRRITPSEARRIIRRERRRRSRFCWVEDDAIEVERGRG
ncbi:MAG: hypothetical protein ABSG73_11485 [Candidatus Aminicenantales bacterium]|jgi:hypothetical protein